MVKDREKKEQSNENDENNQKDEIIENNNDIEKKLEEVSINGKESEYQETIRDDLKNESINHIKVLMFLIIIVIIVTAVVLVVFYTQTIPTNSSPNADAEKIMEAEKIRQAEEDKRQKEQEELQKIEEAKRKEEERQAKLPKLTEQGRQNMENIYHSETKRAFLTFDDGPSNITPQILDTLKEQNVKATFFTLGSNLEIFPETTKRIYNEGHFIASHGYSHVYSSIYESPQSVLDEYNRWRDIIRNTLGEPEYDAHLFRFPGGIPGGKYETIKLEAKQLLSDNGILSIDWNSLTGDAETQHPEADKLMENLKTTTEDKSSVVILMHDAQAKKVTADMLPDIINYLKEQGYEFKTFYDIIK